MLQHFIRKAHNGKTWVSPRVVIGIPSGITQVERRAVEDSAYRAKASEVYLVEEAVAAAIGAGLPITEPHGHIVVDIGGGTTDIAVISLGGIVYSKAVRTAGDAMDDAISEFVKRKYNLLIGERTAEEIKMKLGSAFTFDEPLEMEVRGRNLVEGVPRTITIRDLEVREALDTAVSSIVDAVRVALERTPPELSADIIDRGIVLTGGGALLRNFDKRLQAETGLPVSVAEDPLTSVVVGAGKMLSDFALLKRVKWENTLKYE
jgi:rod shape-determining protein MreB